MIYCIMFITTVFFNWNKYIALVNAIDHDIFKYEKGRGGGGKRRGRHTTRKARFITKDFVSMEGGGVVPRVV